MADIQTANIKVSIIIVNYQTPELIGKLLLSLGNDPSIEIVVVDNSPTHELEGTISQFAPIRYVRNETNLGFAGGVNRGLDGAKGEWIFLLNSDATTTYKDILKLIDLTKQYDAQVAAPKLIKEDGSTEHSVGYFDGPFTHFVNWLFARPRLIDPESFTSPTWFDVATGGALLVHRDIWSRLGHLDESLFFMYFEDIDYCLRMKRQSISVPYVPEVVIYHTGGQTANKDPETKLKNYTNSLHAYIRKHRGVLIQYLNMKFSFFT